MVIAHKFPVQTLEIRGGVEGGVGVGVGMCSGGEQTAPEAEGDPENMVDLTHKGSTQWRIAAWWHTENSPIHPHMIAVAMGRSGEPHRSDRSQWGKRQY